MSHRTVGAFALAVIAALASLSTIVAEAQQTKAAPAKLGVVARVAAFFRLQVQYQAAVFSVARDDIERGYIDVAAASRFSIASNSRAGYVVDFFPIGDLFSAVIISGLSAAVELSSDGGTVNVMQLATSPLTEARVLAYRFLLRPELQPGIYPWPLKLSVHPL